MSATRRIQRGVAWVLLAAAFLVFLPGVLAKLVTKVIGDEN